ncbi:MAG: hypothetical protein ACT4OO_15475 [Nitrospiraceae bacterium]
MITVWCGGHLIGFTFIVTAVTLAAKKASGHLLMRVVGESGSEAQRTVTS